MALVLKDRVKEQTTTTGTGTVTLGGALSGFDTFASVGNGNTTYYAIVHQTADEWEVGLGTYTAAGTLLSRDTVLESSNADAAVVFSAGTKDVFVTYPADKSVYYDSAGNVTIANTGGTLSTATAGTGNFRAGVNAGNSIASGGNYNTVVGDEAGTANTTGIGNVAIGAAALGANTTANYNTAVGYCRLLMPIPLDLIIQRLALLLLVPTPLEL
jgi:hypothetical protein